MGPWLCSHGNNGALLTLPVSLKLQWGRGCVATEIGRPVRIMGRIGCFNGAVAV